MAFSSALAKASGLISSTPERSHSSTARTVLEEESESGSMSPTTRRTEKWLRDHAPKKSGGGLESRKVKEGRVVRTNGQDQQHKKKRASFWNLALWFGGFGKESQSNHGEEEDLEGNTVIDDDGSAAAAATAPEYDDNDLTLVVDDYDEGTRGHQTAHALKSYNDRYLDYDDPRIQDWTEEERWLFTRFTNRGYEPLLHNTWILDYPTFPDPLFTNDESRVYINNIHTSTGRGTHARSAWSCLRCG